MRKVFVVNYSSHDFSEAEKYGELVFLSDGRINRYETNSMIRNFTEKMADSSPKDYIVLCSLSVMNSIACAVFAHLHGRLNLLLFKDNTYIERNHVLMKGKKDDNGKNVEKVEKRGLAGRYLAD